MVPASITATATLTNAGQVVGEFGGLILLVGGLALGVFGVRFLIRQIKAAR